MHKEVDLSNLDIKNKKIDWVSSALNKKIVNFKYDKYYGYFIITS